MPSSRTDDRDARLHELASLYDTGYGALVADEFERLAVLLDRADALIASGAFTAIDEATSAVPLQRARAAWNRLHDALAQAREQTRQELGGMRKNGKAMRAYVGSARRSPTVRHDSEV